MRTSLTTKRYSIASPSNLAGARSAEIQLMYAYRPFVQAGPIQTCWRPIFSLVGTC